MILQVWIIWGDGSTGYSIAEFDTFHRHNVPIVGLVCKIFFVHHLLFIFFVWADMFVFSVDFKL